MGFGCQDASETDLGPISDGFWSIFGTILDGFWEEFEIEKHQKNIRKCEIPEASVASDKLNL